MDAGASASLLEWVSSFGESFSSLKDLHDARHLLYLIKHMQQDQSEATEAKFMSEECVTGNFWDQVRQYLEGSNYHTAAESINYEDAESGVELEIAKIVMLLLSLSITCPNHPKIMSDMTNLSNETQWGIRFILSETLDEDKSPNADIFEVLQRKAVCDQDGESAISMSLSPAKSSGMTSFLSPIGESPVSVLSRPTLAGNRSITFQTPVKQIFKTSEEELVYSAPASCPPFRKSWNSRMMQESPSFLQTSECSPMQEFLSSPVVNYKIKIRDLNQKNSILSKNLHAERVAREESDKFLIEKESLIEDLQHKVRDLTRSVAEKQQLFDEIDELHEVRQQRDTLERENAILKHRIEKFDTYAQESKDVKKILDSQYKRNDDLSKQVKSLQTSLARMKETSQHSTVLEDSLKSLQHKNSLLEEEISEVTMQLRKMKSQNMEQKEYYESQIQEYKTLIENKDAVEGESMGLFMEQRVEELQKRNDELGHDLEILRKELGSMHDMLKTKDNTIGNMNEEIARLKVRNSSLQDSYDILMDEKQKVHNSLIASTAKWDKINAFNEELKVDLVALENKVVDLDHEKMIIRNELVSKKGDITILEEKLRTTTSGLETSIQENCRIMRELAMSADSLTYAKSEISELRNEIVQFQCKLTDADQQIEQMQTNEMEMEEEVSKLKEQLKVESEKSSVLRIELDENKIVTEANLKEIEDLKKDLESNKEKMKVDLVALENKMVDLDHEKMNIRNELDSKKGDIIILEEKLRTTTSGLETSIQENCRIMKELEMSAESLTYAKSEISELRNEIVQFQCKLTDADQQIEQMHTNEMEMEEEVSKLKEQLKVESEKSSVLRIELDENKIVTEANLKEIEDLKKDLESNKERMSLVDIFENKCRALEEQIVILSTARDGAVLDLMRVNSELEISEDNHKEEIRRFEMKIQTMKGDLEHHQEDNKTLRTLCKQLQDDNKNLMTEHSELKLENLENISKANQFETVHDSLKKLEKENSLLVISNSDMKLENESLVCKLDESKSLRNSLNSVEEENKELETLNTELKCENEHLKARLDNKENTAGLLKSVNDDLLKSNSCLQQKVTDFSNTIATMREELEDKDEEIVAMKSSHESILVEKNLLNAKERQLKEELFAANRELLELNAKLKTISDEKEDYVKRCSVLQDESDLLQIEVQDFIACIERLKAENLHLQNELDTVKEEASANDEKLKAVRSQFADRYRVKQERVASVERELEEWQARAEEQTAKYDKMARMYNDKRTQLDESNKKCAQVQEEIRRLRLENETLTRNSSRLNVRKIEEDKKIQSLSSQVQRLQTQLEHADRQIRSLRNDARFSSRPSSISSNILCSVEEVVTPRRMTLSMDDLQHENILFRSQSDKFLDSPSAVNQRSLDDSLESALKTPVNVKSRRRTLGSDAIIPFKSSNEAMGRSCISMESSLLSDSQNQARQYSSHPQLSESQVKQECLDKNMNSSTSVQSINGKSKRNVIVSSLPNALGQLALHTEEEPGHDLEFGSLSRVAELQGRNAGALPHLKSSYPVETQGQTPSKCDESVRIGSASRTLRRLSVMPEQTQRDLASSMEELSTSTSRRTTIGGYSAHHPSSLQELHDIAASRRKSSLIDAHLKKPQRIDRSTSCSIDTAIMEESFWKNELPEQESQEQVDPRRESVMFEIPNSPRRPAMRNRTKKAQTGKTSERASSNPSKKLTAPVKTPDKMKNKKILDDKKRTPSLMDRMKKPFSKK